MSILERLMETAGYFNQALLKDSAIAITDLNQYLYYMPGTKLNHRVKAGDPIKEGTLAAQAMKSGKQQVAVMDSQLFGFPYIGTATPVFDETGKRVIGCIFIGENTETQEMIKANTEAIADNMIAVNEKTQMISGKMQELRALQTMLMNRLETFDEELKGIEAFSKIIGGIAKQTNMLGINAAIESARLGEAGRGFAVVADEIGKLAKRSQESVTSITETTEHVQQNSQTIVGEMSTIGTITHEMDEILSKVAEDIEQASGMLQELSSMSQIE